MRKPTILPNGVIVHHTDSTREIRPGFSINPGDKVMVKFTHYPEDNGEYIIKETNWEEEPHYILVDDKKDGVGFACDEDEIFPII